MFKQNENKISSITIEGGLQLFGEVSISGDKIITTHLIYAALFCYEEITICNPSFCGEVEKILYWIEKYKIASLDVSNDYIRISNQNLERLDLSDISDNRASICISANILIVRGKVKIQEVGGCNFMKRTIDCHIRLLNKISCDNYDDMTFSFNRCLQSITFDCLTNNGYSVGVTIHALLTAYVFNGEIMLYNTSLDPAVKFTIKLLEQATNRKIKLFNRKIHIEACDNIYYRKANIHVCSDLTEILTYASMIMSSGGNLLLTNLVIEDMIYINFLIKVGVYCEFIGENELFLSSDNIIIHPGDIICTPYPGISTDVGPIIVASLAKHIGSSIVIDTVYSSRSTHVEGMNKMGFNLIKNENKVKVIGTTPNNKFCSVYSHDIRAGAALVIGALARNGVTRIDNWSQLYRGYPNLVHNLENIGAKVSRNG